MGNQQEVQLCPINDPLWVRQHEGHGELGSHCPQAPRVDPCQEGCKSTDFLCQKLSPAWPGRFPWGRERVTDSTQSWSVPAQEEGWHHIWEVWAPGDGPKLAVVTVPTPRCPDGLPALGWEAPGVPHQLLHLQQGFFLGCLGGSRSPRGSGTVWHSLHLQTPTQASGAPSQQYKAPACPPGCSSTGVL